MRTNVDFSVTFALQGEEQFTRPNIAVDPDVMIDRVIIHWDPTDPEGWYEVKAKGKVTTKTGAVSKSSSNHHYARLTLDEENEWLERAKAASTRSRMEPSTTTT